VNTPNTSPPPAGESDPVVRRARYATRTAVLLTAVTAVCLLSAVLGARAHTRIDLTATREHSLSPRTRSILEAVKQDTTIVVSADAARSDPQAWRRITDLLGEFERAGTKVHAVAIDTASTQAGAEVDRVVAALAERDARQLEEHQQALKRVEADLAEIAPRLQPLAETASGSAGVPGLSEEKSDALKNIAAALRVAAKDCADAVDRVRSARESGPSAGPVRLPESDLAQKAAGPPLDAARKAIQALIDQGAVKREQVGTLSDQVAAAVDRLNSLKPLEPLLVARLLRAQQAAIVYSTAGTTAIDFDALFPRAGAAEGRALFAGEELLSTAVASLSLPVRPVIVLVHAEKERLLDANGRPTASTQGGIGKLAERLSLRRYDLAEWVTAEEPSRPSLSRLDPKAERPRVWFVMPAPARLNLDPRKGMSLADRGQRIGKLADALRLLLDAGENVMLSLEPCELPAVGQPDPMVEPLKPWGIRPDTGHPLLEQIGTPRGPAISCYQTLRSAETANPIGQAINGLATILHWPMPIGVEPTPGVTASPLLVVHGTEQAQHETKPPAAGAPDEKAPTNPVKVWGESSWLQLRYANVRQPFQALVPPDMPTPDPKRDNVTGPFTLAVTAEKPRAGAQASGRSGPQRLAVIAAPSWFEDAYTQAAATVDGRRVWMFPGNSELFESALHWLAGMDELIAPSPRARDVARIQPMTEGRLAAIRWALIAGLPIGVLALGLAVRVFRG